MNPKRERARAGAEGPPTPTPEPKVFVISGPSGVGKTTLVRGLLSRVGVGARVKGLHFSVSCTTRPPRPDEVHGRDYYFVSRGQFERLLREGRFLEHAQVYQHWYGTLREEVERPLARGQSVILDIDTQGARQVRRRGRRMGLPLVFIFVLPPSLGELRRRIEHRRSEPPEQLELRFQAALREIEAGWWFDYFLVNSKLEVALRELERLIQLEQGLDTDIMVGHGSRDRSRG